MYTPRQCGVKFDPPALVLYYVINATGKLYLFFVLYSALPSFRTYLKSFRHEFVETLYRIEGNHYHLLPLLMFFIYLVIYEYEWYKIWWMIIMKFFSGQNIWNQWKYVSIEFMRYKLMLCAIYWCYVQIHRCHKPIQLKDKPIQLKDKPMQLKDNEVTIWPAAGHGLSNTKWPAV
jgi:hypothetical protein